MSEPVDDLDAAEEENEWNEGSYDEDEDLEEGEVNLFASMPWINPFIGSMMEAQLLRFNDSDQCRNCGKRDEALRASENGERFCSPECRKEWYDLLEVRIAQGKHDLRVRGYD